MRPELLASPDISGLFDRISGAPAHGGQQLRLLIDAGAHEAATLDLVARARRHILIENYCLDLDPWGHDLLDALVARARDGVQVCLLTDWLGSRQRPDRALRQHLARAGVQWRQYNPFQPLRPLAALARNHRKSLLVDDATALVSGWCLSARWRGLPGGDPWRDTGLLLHGSAVRAVAAAFHDSWSQAGPALLATAHADDPMSCPAGDWPVTDATVRILAGAPGNSPLFRTDQLAIGLARRRLWLTDAYPAGTPMYLDSLQRAARAGVDVRLLVPGSNDLPVVGLVARSGYRNLLDAGVRVFEWSGAMLHAKTAVMDDCWVRIGSSNLNPASWLGNRELDVIVEDDRLGQLMAAQFEQDLQHAVEIVCDTRQFVRLSSPRHRQHPPAHHLAPITTLRLTRAMAQSVRIQRPLTPADAAVLGSLGGLALGLALLTLLLPTVAAGALGLLAALVGITLLRMAWRRYRLHQAREIDPPQA